MRKLLLGLALAFGLGLNAQVENDKSPLYTSEQLQWFNYYSEYNREFDGIVWEFVKDAKEELGVDLNFDDIKVFAFDYRLLDVLWEKEVSEYVIGMALGMYNDDEVLVILNKEKVENFNFAQLKSTIYHELMHDVFNYEHHHESDMLMSRAISNNDKNIEFVEHCIKEAFDILRRGEHQDHEEPIKVLEVKKQGVEPLDVDFGGDVDIDIN